MEENATKLTTSRTVQEVTGKKYSHMKHKGHFAFATTYTTYTTYRLLAHTLSHDDDVVIFSVLSFKLR